MRKIFLLIILIVLIWFINFYFNNSNSNSKNNSIIGPSINKAKEFISQNIDFLNNDAPCNKPLTYKIGEFDSRFLITKEEFIKSLEDAENIWESKIQKDLFKYDQNNGQITVNLIFDYRQEATNKLTSIDNELKDGQAKYNKVKSEYDKIKSQYNVAISKYNLHLKSFNQESLKYQNQVKYWNTKGGAPKNEFTILQNQKQLLDQKYKSLQIEQKNVNELATNVNTLAIELNRLADVLNLNVKNYNTIGEQLGETFKEGLYTKDNTTEKIDIYEFSNNQKLVRVIAHEFGHAMGIDHLKDPNSIMYEQNQSNNLELTNEDMGAFNLICSS